MAAPPLSAALQIARYHELKEIVDRITEWVGSEAEAFAWCRSNPIAGFGGKTAEQLVMSGEAAAVRGYLDHIAVGGYA